MSIKNYNIEVSESDIKPNKTLELPKDTLSFEEKLENVNKSDKTGSSQNRNEFSLSSNPLERLKNRFAKQENIESNESSIGVFTKEVKQDKLSDEIKATFKDGNYHTVETLKDLTAYRVYGDKAPKEGRFLSLAPPTDRMDSKMELALRADWRNSRNYYCEVVIPKGTKINIGIAAEQKTTEGNLLQGGATQILVSEEFVKNTNHYKEGHILTYATNYLDFDKKAQKMENK